MSRVATTASTTTTTTTTTNWELLYEDARLRHKKVNDVIVSAVAIAEQKKTQTKTQEKSNSNPEFSSENLCNHQDKNDNDGGNKLWRRLNVQAMNARANQLGVLKEAAGVAVDDQEVSWLNEFLMHLEMDQEETAARSKAHGYLMERTFQQPQPQHYRKQSVFGATNNATQLQSVTVDVDAFFEEYPESSRFTSSTASNGIDNNDDNASDGDDDDNDDIIFMGNSSKPLLASSGNSAKHDFPAAAATVPRNVLPPICQQQTQQPQNHDTINRASFQQPTDGTTVAVEPWNNARPPSHNQAQQKHANNDSNPFVAAAPNDQRQQHQVKQHEFQPASATTTNPYKKSHIKNQFQQEQQPPHNDNLQPQQQQPFQQNSYQIVSSQNNNHHLASQNPYISTQQPHPQQKQQQQPSNLFSNSAAVSAPASAPYGGAPSMVSHLYHAPPLSAGATWEDHHAPTDNPFQTAREYSNVAFKNKNKTNNNTINNCNQQKNAFSNGQGWMQTQQHQQQQNYQQPHPANGYGQNQQIGQTMSNTQNPQSYFQQQQQPPNAYQQQQPSNAYIPYNGMPHRPPSPPPPDKPSIRDSLKRKFQPPKRGTLQSSQNQQTQSSASSSNNHYDSRNKHIIKSNTGGGAVPKNNGLVQRPSSSCGNNKSNNGNDDSEEEELPEELKRFGKELVQKIQDEIMDCGEPITFNDIAGLKDAKQTVLEVVCWPMKRPDLFTGLRRAPNGLLLYGPPGTGKTLVGKAIAHESGATFFSISSSSLTSKWIGEGEKLVRTLFAVASYHEPAVVFIDEIDSLLTQRKADENEASRRIKTEFLVQLDGTGTGTQGRVLVIGATNRPQELDEAARRRFVKRLYIPLPEQEDREILLGVLLSSNNHQLTDAEIKKLAVETAGFSGADIKALSTDAALGPIRDLGSQALNVEVRDVPPISYKHFRQALRGMRPSVGPSEVVQYVEWDKTYGSKRADNYAEDDDE